MSDIVVRKTSYGVFIEDTVHIEGVAVDQEDIRKLITDLQEHLPWDLNEVAIPKPKPSGHDCVRQLGCCYPMECVNEKRCLYR